MSLVDLARDRLGLLRAYCEARDFVGPDPFDALRSPVLSRLSRSSRWLRIGFIQALRRLPVDVRPFLLISNSHNSKALGLFLEGYVRLAASGDEDARTVVSTLVELLAAKARPEGGGHGWGYNFDWQSRVFFLPAETPTVVATTFVGHALLDAYEELGDERALELAVPAGRFICGGLNRPFEHEDELCFSYSGIDEYAVHNANLLGASLLGRLGTVVDDPDHRTLASRSMKYTVSRQRPDGSWRYSERPGSHWVDSFHTGFNLEALARLLSLQIGLEHSAAFDLGLRYYRKTFFSELGVPGYMSDRVYPIDIHAPAEAVTLLSQLGPQHYCLADRVLEWTLKNMQDPGGFFYFRRYPAFALKVPYMRWSQAWAFRALCAYVTRQETKHG